MGVGYYECNYASIGRQAPRQTIRWLDKHGVPYRDLCFMGQKDQVGADVYVDDSPDNIAGLRAAGHYAICFANSANKGIEAPRARKWDEVYALIKQRWPAPAVSVDKQ